ncbi:MAG: PEP-CTERM sorting domain-containing protein [Sedimentisphaerales bacterium]|nr:PEP-CTERM sorting domain-containing protein [Sedimentisphaerales bacterium]
MKNLAKVVAVVLFACAAFAQAEIVFTDGFEGVTANPYTVAAQVADGGLRTDADPLTTPPGSTVNSTVDETLLYMTQVTDVSPIGAHSGDNYLRCHRSVINGTTQYGYYYIWTKVIDNTETMTAEFWMSGADTNPAGVGFSYMTVTNSVTKDSLNLGLKDDGSVVYYNGGADWVATGDTWAVGSEWVKFTVEYTAYAPTISFAVNDGAMNTINIWGDPMTMDIWRLRFMGYNMECLLDDVSIDVVPEPATLTLLGLGLAGLLRRRR